MEHLDVTGCNTRLVPFPLDSIERDLIEFAIRHFSPLPEAFTHPT